MYTLISDTTDIFEKYGIAYHNYGPSWKYIAELNPAQYMLLVLLYEPRSSNGVTKYGLVWYSYAMVISYRLADSHPHEIQYLERLKNERQDAIIRS